MQTPVTASSLFSKYTQPLTFYNLKREGGAVQKSVHPSALNHYFLQVFCCAFYGPKYKDSSDAMKLITDNLYITILSVPQPRS